MSKSFFDFWSFKHKMLRVGGNLETQRDNSRFEFCSIKLVIKKITHLNYTNFADTRNVYLPRKFISRPSVSVFHNIVKPGDTQTVLRVAKYSKIILNT